MYAEKQFAANNGGPGAFASVPPTAPGVLEAELNANSSCVALLATAVDELEDKMRNILRPEQPQGAPVPAPSAGPSVVPPTPSAMVLEVQKQRTHIDAITARVDWIRERLEA